MPRWDSHRIILADTVIQKNGKIEGKAYLPVKGSSELLLSKWEFANQISRPGNN